MHKTIQYFSLLITLFLFSSVPSYTNTEKPRSRRQLKLTNRQNEKEKKKKPSQKRKTAKISKKETKFVPIAFTVVIVGGISALIFFFVKKHTSSAENDQANDSLINNLQNSTNPRSSDHNSNAPLRNNSQNSTNLNLLDYKKLKEANLSGANNPQNKKSELNYDDWNVTLANSPGEQGNEATLTVTLNSKNVKKDKFLEEINCEREDIKGFFGETHLQYAIKNSQIVIQNFRMLSLYEEENNDAPKLQISVSYRNQQKTVDISLDELKKSLQILSQTKNFFKVENNLSQTIQKQNEYLDTYKEAKKDENMALLYAVKKGYLEVVHFYLKENTREKLDFKYSEEKNSTLLHIAVINKKTSIVKMLIWRQANLYIQNDDDQTPFELMISQYETVKNIISLMKHIDFQDNDLNTLLHCAFLTGKTEIAQELIANGANTFIRNKEEATAFSLVMSKNIPVNKAKKSIDTIIKYNQDDVNARDGNRYRLLEYAALGKNIEIAKYLIKEKKANVDLVTEEPDCETVLDLLIAEIEFTEKAKELIDAIIKSNKQYRKGKKTLLHYAAKRNKIALVKYLIEKKNTEFDITDKYNRTPMHYAALEGALEVVKLIIEKAEKKKNKNALLNIKDKYQQKTAVEDAQEKLKELNIQLKKGIDTLNEKQKKEINNKIKDYNEIIILITPT